MPDLAALDNVHEDVTLTGQLARPAGEGARPAILVMHDAIGMGPHVLRKASALADAGYVALAADMYGPEIRSGDPDAHGRLFMALQQQPDLLRARALSWFDALRALPGVDPLRVSAIGYCFGGKCVLELARSGAALRSVVSFHGLLTTHRPAARGDVKARILALTGALDPYAPAGDLAGFQAEMAAAEADWQVTLYGTGLHAFTDPDVGRRDDIPGVRYDPLLDRLSWASATEFLAATLTGE